MSEKLPTTGQAYSFNTDKLNRPLYYTYDREDPKKVKTRLSEEALLDSVTIPEQSDRELYNQGVEDGKFEANKDKYGKLETEGFPKSASWSSLYNGEFQAKVLGKYETGDYLIELSEEVNGSLQHIVPAGELVIVEERAEESETADSAEDSTDSPEVQALKQELAELKEMVASLKATIEDLQKQLALARGETVDNVPSVEQEPSISPLEAAIAEFPIGKRVKVMHKGELEEWAIAGKPEEGRDGVIEVLVLRQKGDRGEYKTFSVDQLREWENLPAAAAQSGEGQDKPEDTTERDGDESHEESVDAENQRGPVGKLWDRIKDYASGRKLYVWVNSRGVPERVSEKEVKDKDKRRCLGLALGALAVGWVAGKYGVPFVDIIGNDDGGSRDALDALGNGSGSDSHHSYEDALEEHLDIVNSEERHDTGHSYGEGSEHHHHDHDHDGHDSGDHEHGDESGENTAETPSSGERFYVEPGNGITHEIQQYAQLHGVNIDGSKAHQIYEQLEASQSGRIIDLHGTPNDQYWYQQAAGNGEWRISSPGTATWYPEAETQLRAALGLS